MKFHEAQIADAQKESRPARGAWIEIQSMD